MSLTQIEICAADDDFEEKAPMNNKTMSALSQSLAIFIATLFQMPSRARRCVASLFIGHTC